MLQLRSSTPEARLAGPIARILEVQQADGRIPWFEDGPWDSWNHAECVMALAVAGEFSAARGGLDALAQAQGSDGAFLCDYGNALPMADHVSIARIEGPKVKDTNFTAYVATAVEHYRRLKGTKAAGEYWPMVRAAVDHVIQHQHEAGDISWCAEAHGTSLDDALIAGNASIYASFDHAIALAEAMKDPQPRWRDAHRRLGEVLRCGHERFDRSGQERGDFAMDWYYPVMTGVINGAEAASRLHQGWVQFVEAELGCRCVADQPWVTVAETNELIIAALRCGMADEAAVLLDWIEHRRDDQGAFWMGWQFEETIIWPAERPSWTQAAYVLAVDAFEGLTPASRIFAD